MGNKTMVIKLFRLEEDVKLSNLEVDDYHLSGKSVLSKVSLSDICHPFMRCLFE